MDGTNYGKIVWTDAPSKNAGMWKTALLLLTIIFLMNGLASSQMYLVLAVLTGFSYFYLSRRPDSIITRTRVYENGILASVSEDGPGLSTAKERFFAWGAIKGMSVKKIGRLAKNTVLKISCNEGTYSANLEKTDEFLSECKKLRKNVETG